MRSLREKCPYSELFWSVFSRIIYSASLRIQSECRKLRTKITPNTQWGVRLFVFSSLAYQNVRITFIENSSVCFKWTLIFLHKRYFTSWLAYQSLSLYWDILHVTSCSFKFFFSFHVILPSKLELWNFS